MSLPPFFEEWKDGLRFVIRRFGRFVSWEKAYWYTIHVLNYAGTGVGKSKDKWTFTVSGKFASSVRCKDKTLKRIYDASERIAGHVCDELGLHNEGTPTTSGTEIDRASKRSSLTRPPGVLFYAVEDDDVASFLIGPRQSFVPKPDRVLNKVKRDAMFTYEGGAVHARMAYKGLRAIQDHVELAFKRWG